MVARFFIWLLFYFSSSIICWAQVSTIQIKPGPANGKDAYLSSFGSSTNYGTHPEFSALAWTCNSTQCIGRGLLQFDLSSIPVGSIVQSATLSLFSNPAPLNGNGQSMFGANGAKLYRVTSPWDESMVTYDSMPSVSSSSYINLLSSTSSFQNYIGINVTNLVSFVVANPNANYGWMLRLDNESPYASMIFASSDYADPLKWPELNVTYSAPSINDTCVLLSLADALASDAYLSSNSFASNYGGHPEIAGLSWTCQGVPCYGRSLLNFNFSSIPQNAIVTSAKLNLLAMPTPVNGNGIAMQGTNTSVIQRVVTPWAENGVTWQSQPNTVSQNEVVLPMSTLQFEDYLNIDITNLAIDMLSNPSGSFGMLLKLQNETGYTSMIFASSDYGNGSLSPSLELCYTLPTSLIYDFTDSYSDSLIVYPNPSNDGSIALKFKLKQFSKISFTVFDNQCRVLAAWDDVPMELNSTDYKVKLSDFFEVRSGSYLLQVNIGGRVITKRFVLIVQ